MNDLSVGQRLFFLRGKVSRKVFAEKLGVGTATLQRYENDERRPDLEFLMKVCELTGLSLDYLVYGKHNQTLSKNEKIVLENYRQANADTKNQVLMLLLNGVLDDNLSKDKAQSQPSTLTETQTRQVFNFLFNDSDDSN